MAIGKGVSNQADFQAAINKLVEQQNNDVKPPVLPPATDIPSKIGIGSPKVPKPNDSTGGGIASPLTENAYSTREFYTGVTLATTDGIFSTRTDVIKKIKMTDANNASVEFIYSQPT